MKKYVRPSVQVRVLSHRVFNLFGKTEQLKEKEMKQTAVEWLIDELAKFDSGKSEYFSDVAIKNHATRMHKKQIIDAWENGNAIEFYDETDTMAINYYNKTYGAEK